MSIIRKVKRFGWIPDIPDARDQMFAAPMPATELPASVDLSPNCPPPYEQGELGSCTANAIGLCYQYNQRKQGIPNFVPSRLFIYYNIRAAINTIESDSGGMLRDGIKSVSRDGAPSEDLWPYHINKFRDKPSKDIYAEGEKHQAVLYQRIVRDINQMKGCLYGGFPFVLGFSVYPQFESREMAKTGILRMPEPSEEVIGGHATTCVGYSDEKQSFLIQNSYGANWGLEGRFWMPYTYITQRNLSSDFWAIKFVE